jgi:regulator of sirC expression with transglutaminase-like and TPR domain
LSEEAQIEALIALIDDPDPEVSNHVFDKLLEMGSEVVPRLEAAWEKQPDEHFQNRIEELLNQIQFAIVEREIKSWLAHENDDFLEACLALNKLAYPQLESDFIRQRVAGIRRSILVELNPYLSPLEKTHIFNQILYHQLAFKGSELHAAKPESAYISAYLDQRKGGPLVTAMLHLLVAQRLDLPVYGVALPRHPILAFTDGFIHDFKSADDLRQMIEFYIYPYRQGAVVTARDIENYLGKMGAQVMPEYFIPVDNREFFKHCLISLKELYLEDEQAEKAKQVNRLIRLFE